jgi:hypothetical protein
LSDGTGEIVALGENVTRLAIGVALLAAIFQGGPMARSHWKWHPISLDV